jgi:hypothetical protein
MKQQITKAMIALAFLAIAACSSPQLREGKTQGTFIDACNCEIRERITQAGNRNRTFESFVVVPDGNGYATAITYTAEYSMRLATSGQMSMNEAVNMSNTALSDSMPKVSRRYRADVESLKRDCPKAVNSFFHMEK